MSMYILPEVSALDLIVMLFLLVLVLTAFSSASERSNLTEKSILSDVERGNREVFSKDRFVHLNTQLIGEVLDWIKSIFALQSSFIESHDERRYENSRKSSLRCNTLKDRGPGESKRGKLKSKQNEYSDSHSLNAASVPSQILAACPATAVYQPEEWEEMRYAQNRLDSFNDISMADLGVPAPTTPASLARDGFFLDRGLQRPRCFSCGGIYPDHFPACDRRIENIPVSQTPSPPSSPQPDNLQMLNVAMRLLQPAAHPRPPSLTFSSESGNLPENVSGNSSEIVPGNSSENASGNSSENVPGNSSENASGNSALDTRSAAPSDYPAFGHTQRLANDNLHEHTSQGLNPSSEASEMELGANGGESTRPEKFSEANSNRTQPCRFCREYPIEIVFLPCGHLVACKRCAENVQVCSVCRLAITHKSETV